MKLSKLAEGIEALFLLGLSKEEIAEELGTPLGVVEGWFEGNVHSESHVVS
jgi:DNA-directed RNA polymerase specialized sigma24 family protein